jgi:hypothetical protein
MSPSGQEAQPLAGLDRRAGQDQPADLLVEQRPHRQRHRQVGLAGAGRAHREHDVVAADQVEVLLLGQALGRDRPAAPRHQHGVAEDRRQLGRGVGRQHLDRPHHVVGGEVLAAAGEGVELLERRPHHRGRRLVALDGDLVAAQVELRPRRPLDQLQAGVVGTGEDLERLGVVEGQLVPAAAAAVAGPHWQVPPVQLWPPVQVNHGDAASHAAPMA